MDLKRRLIEQPDRVERNQQQHGEPINANDRGEQLLQELSDDKDQAANNKQEPPAVRSGESSYPVKLAKRGESAKPGISACPAGESWGSTTTWS